MSGEIERPEPTGDPEPTSFDMGDLFAQAQQMGEQLMAAQAAAAEVVVEGQAGGGAVRIEATGAGEFLSVTIRPDVVEAGDVEMLQDLVLAALHDTSARLVDLAGGGGLDVGGLDLGGLDIGKLLGGSE